MNQEKRKLIDEFVDMILKNYNIIIPISDIEKVVENIGGKIKIDRNVPDGRIEKSENNFVVFVSDNNFNVARTRFTIAHELGHLFLHMGYGTQDWEENNTKSYNRLGSSEDESDANEFAASFLMPASEYKKQIDKLVIEEDGKKIVDITKIADFFGVSTLAASNRGKFLGILKWQR